MVNKAPLGGDLLVRRRIPKLRNDLVRRWQEGQILRHRVGDDVLERQRLSGALRLVQRPSGIERNAENVPNREDRNGYDGHRNCRSRGSGSCDRHGDIPNRALFIAFRGAKPFPHALGRFEEFGRVPDLQRSLRRKRVVDHVGDASRSRTHDDDLCGKEDGFRD